MQISVLKKLLQLIKNEIPEEEKSSEATSEQSPERSDENSKLEIRNSESENGGDEGVQSAEFIVQNYEDEEVLNEDEQPTLTENNRSHLTSSVPRAAKTPVGSLTKGELREIRELFKNLDDNEIQRLYKKVTK